MGNCTSFQEIEASADGATPSDSIPLCKVEPDAKTGVVAISANASAASIAASVPCNRPLTSKRAAILAEVSDKDVEITYFPKTAPERELIERAVHGNLLFDMLAPSALARVIGSMTPLEVAANTEIIRQGDTDAKLFFVLAAGACEAFIEGDTGQHRRKVYTYKPGTGFGELALLYSAPRAATVETTTACRLWVMERAVYNAIKLEHAAAESAEKLALINALPLLKMLRLEQKQKLADAMDKVRFSKGDHLFREGDAGDRCYLLRAGVVKLHSSVGDPRTVKAGGCIGERALLEENTRSTTAVAQEHVKAFCLVRHAVQELLGPIQLLWRLEVLRRVPVLYTLKEHQLATLAGCMAVRSFAAGDVVFCMGDPGDGFYVVEEGEFTIYKTDASEEIARAGPGGCFGERALLRSEPRAATVQALTRGTLLRLERSDFATLGLGKLESIRHGWRFENLRKVPLLSSLPSDKVTELSTLLRELRVSAGQTIVGKGEDADWFCIVEAGACSAAGSNGSLYGKRIGPGSYFGEAALLGEGTRPETVVATDSTALLTLKRSDFVRVVGRLSSEAVKKATSNMLKHQPSPSESQLSMADFQQVAVLGAGAFGQVLLVRKGSEYFALKKLSKAHLKQSGLHEHVKREKSLMMACNCPFMVRIIGGFQDTEFLYMVLEAAMGGEFFMYMQTRETALREDSARFYAAAVILGLEYMQKHDLVWRDLKPENLLLDTNGYIKMADFGFCKKLVPGTKAYTLCGTPEYLAPELVTQSGHTGAVDWWAVGVLIYEMVAGCPPFYHENKVKLFKAICDVQYAMPRHFSKELADLVSKLLVFNPSRRLGVLSTGAAGLKSHPWFNGFDWDKFARRELPAPYIPVLSSNEDVSNFDSTNVEAGWATMDKRDRYVSTGFFADF